MSHLAQLSASACSLSGSITQTSSGVLGGSAAEVEQTSSAEKGAIVCRLSIACRMSSTEC